MIKTYQIGLQLILCGKSFVLLECELIKHKKQDKIKLQGDRYY